MPCSYKHELFGHKSRHDDHYDLIARALFRWRLIWRVKRHKISASLNFARVYARARFQITCVGKRRMSKSTWKARRSFQRKRRVIILRNQKLNQLKHILAFQLQNEYFL